MLPGDSVLDYEERICREEAGAIYEFDFVYAMDDRLHTFMREGTFQGHDDSLDNDLDVYAYVQRALYSVGLV